VAYQLDSYARYEAEGTTTPPRPPVDPEAVRRSGSDGSPPRFFVFTPDQAVEYLEQRAARLPVEHAIVWADVAAMPEEVVQRHVQLVCTAVAPRFASSAAQVTPGASE
jgi:hypothetical protein